jgi:hypothetical protein
LAIVTDDQTAAIEMVATRFGQTVEHVASSPLFLIGPLTYVAERLHQMRDDYGFSYIVFTGGFEHELAPLVQDLTGT